MCWLPLKTTKLATTAGHGELGQTHTVGSRNDTPAADAAAALAALHDELTAVATGVAQARMLSR
jgi:hypothetical protein